jgi:putative membrane protein
MSLLFATCLVIGNFTVSPTLPFLSQFGLGLIAGVTLFLLAMLADFAANLVGLKKDPIFNLRRCAALSLGSNLLYLTFILIASVCYMFLNDSILWLRLFFLGLCAVFILRLLVFSAISFAKCGRVIFYSTMQPGLYVIHIFFLQRTRGSFPMSSILPFFGLALAVGLFATFSFLLLLNRTGSEILGEKSLSVLKVFMANWTEDLNGPLENLLEKLSVERNIKLSIIMFRAGGKPKAAMVVPAFHPGPFKNVGSSALPYLIQKELENKLKCVVSVPHGISGHGSDLASQFQNQKIIKTISKKVDTTKFNSTTTPFVRDDKNGAHASCQIFGQCALFTLTLAPKSMEDLPPSLEFFIAEETRKRGLLFAITIDAHNSIEGRFNIEKVISSLKEAAVASLETALKSQKVSFEVGAAKLVPQDFSLEEGMGPGGICVIAVKANDRLVAYITIDGNNMVSGLRERILQKLSQLGFEDGEVLTTDTHVVNGIVPAPRGYHPLGETFDQERFIKYIEQAAQQAKSNLQPAEASCFTIVASGIRVIGEKQVEMLCMLTERAFIRAKRLALTIFPLVALIWTTLLLIPF